MNYHIKVIVGEFAKYNNAISKRGNLNMLEKEFEALERTAWLVDKLRLSPSTIYRKLANKEIPSVIVSNGFRKKSYRVRPSEIEKWLTTRRC